MEFAFEHEFRAPSLEAYWRCYLDPVHVGRLDAELGLKSRELLESTETDGGLYRRFHIVPGRELPGWLQKITRAGLAYEERSTFRRADNCIDVEVIPEMFTERTTIRGLYSLELVGEGRVVRRFAGAVEVRVAVVGKRVERAIVEDMARSYEVAIPLTQACLDRQGDCAGSV